MKHRWPAVWLVLSRSVQLLLGLLILGILSYTIHIVGPAIRTLTGYEVTIAVVTVCWTILSLVLYCTNRLNRTLAVTADVFMFVVWAIVVAHRLKLSRGLILSQKCAGYYGWPLAYNWCHIHKTKAAAMILEMVLFIATAALAFVALKKRGSGGPTPAIGHGDITEPPLGESVAYGPQGVLQHPQYAMYYPAGYPVPLQNPHLQSQQSSYGPNGGMRYASTPPPPYQMGTGNQPRPPSGLPPFPDPSRMR